MVDSFTQHAEKGYCELSPVANKVIIYEPNHMKTGLICIGTIKSPIRLRIRVVSLPLTSAAITIELTVNYPNHLIPWQVSYILKAKSNFTLLCTEYIYTRSDSKQMKFCH